MGFNGFVITDATSYLEHMDCGQMLEAGGSGSLRYLPDTQSSFDQDNSAHYHYGREAAHQILYTVANSSAMNGAMPGSTLTGVPTDIAIRTGINVVCPVLIAVLVLFTVLRFRKKPEVTAENAKKA